MKFLNIFLILTVLTFSSANASDLVKEIKIGTDGAYKPVTYVESGKLIGFDVYLIK